MKYLTSQSTIFLAAILACGLLFGRTAIAGAPWFENRDCPNRQKIHTQFDQNRMSYTKKGEPVSNLFGTGRATCALFLYVCGDRIFKGKEINFDRGEACPPEVTSEAYAGKTVCCDEWKQAKKTKSPCNPLADADCDGIENKADPTPIE